LLFGPEFLAGPGSAPVLADWRRRLVRLDRAGLSKAVGGVADRAGVVEEIGRITVPTLVATGADDVATPPAEARHLAHSIPGARLEIIPRCGHTSTLEQPAVVTALLRDFLAQV
jgi:3-oxoadipate enol-lactonase